MENNFNGPPKLHLIQIEPLSSNKEDISIPDITSFFSFNEKNSFNKNISNTSICSKNVNLTNAKNGDKKRLKKWLLQFLKKSYLKI